MGGREGKKRAKTGGINSNQSIKKKKKRRKVEKKVKKLKGELVCHNYEGICRSRALGN